MDENGIVTRQLGAEAKRDWSQVVSINDERGAIEFIYKPMGSLVVRDRAFPDAASRAEFLAEAKEYARRARDS